MPRRPFDPWVVALVLIGLIGTAGIIAWATDLDGRLPPPHRSAS